MSPGFSPTASDLNHTAAVDDAYESAKKANPTCNKSDFAGGYVAALPDPYTPASPGQEQLRLLG